MRTSTLMGIGLLIVVSLLAPAPIFAAGGDVIWEKQRDVGPQDSSWAVAADDGRVVTLGSTQIAPGEWRLIVRAVAAKTGARLWEDQISGFSFAFGVAVAIEGPRIVVLAGTQTPAGTSQVVLRTYLVKTGELLWEDRWAGLAFSLAAQDNRIVVGAAFPDGDGNRPLVRVYVAKTGVLVWEARHLPPDEFSFEFGAAVGLHGRRVFVSSGVIPIDQGVGVDFIANECFVRSYDLHDGTLLWQVAHAERRTCFMRGVGSDGKTLILSGHGGSEDRDRFPGEIFIVLAFEASTGELLWVDRGPANGNADTAIAMDVEQRLAFVIGWHEVAILLRTYDLKKGERRWEDFVPCPAAGICHGADVAAGGGRVFALGNVSIFDNGTALTANVIRAYDAKSGRLLWDDAMEPASFGPGFGRIAGDGGAVFAAGSISDASGNTDFLVRAYDAK